MPEPQVGDITVRVIDTIAPGGNMSGTEAPAAIVEQKAGLVAKNKTTVEPPNRNLLGKVGGKIGSIFGIKAETVDRSVAEPSISTPPPPAEVTPGIGFTPGTPEVKKVEPAIIDVPEGANPALANGTTPEMPGLPKTATEDEANSSKVLGGNDAVPDAPASSQTIPPVEVTHEETEPEAPTVPSIIEAPAEEAPATPGIENTVEPPKDETTPEEAHPEIVTYDQKVAAEAGEADDVAEAAKNLQPNLDPLGGTPGSAAPGVPTYSPPPALESADAASSTLPEITTEAVSEPVSDIDPLAVKSDTTPPSAENTTDVSSSGISTHATNESSAPTETPSLEVPEEAPPADETNSSSSLDESVATSSSPAAEAPAPLTFPGVAASGTQTPEQIASAQSGGGLSAVGEEQTVTSVSNGDTPIEANPTTLPSANQEAGNPWSSSNLTGEHSPEVTAEAPAVSPTTTNFGPDVNGKPITESDIAEASSGAPGLPTPGAPIGQPSPVEALPPAATVSTEPEAPAETPSPTIPAPVEVPTAMPGSEPPTTGASNATQPFDNGFPPRTDLPASPQPEPVAPPTLSPTPEVAPEAPAPLTFPGVTTPQTQTPEQIADVQSGGGLSAVGVEPTTVTSEEIRPAEAA